MLSLLIKPVSEFLGSALGKVAIVASLLASLLAIYALYDSRDKAQQEILIEKGRAEVIEQNYKELLEQKEQDILDLKADLERQSETLESFRIENDVIMSEISRLRKKIDTIKTDKEITETTKEIMKCFTKC